MAQRKLKKTGKKRSSYREIEKLIVPAAELDPPRVFMIYGRQGVGKTILCASAPKTLVIDTERGGASLRRIKGVKVHRISHFSEIDPIYWYLREAPHEFLTVAIDTITRLTGMALKFAMGEPAGEPRGVEDINFPNKRDWGGATELMKDVILRFSELPLNIIFTAHERTYETEEEEIISGPVVNPGVRQVLLGSVDITGRLYVKEVQAKGKKRTSYERRLLVGPHELYESKDRSGILPSIIRKPDMTKILSTLKKGNGG